MLTVGWIPGYLVFNFSGPSKYKGKNANHFSPSAVFFEKHEYWLVVQSVTAFFLALGGVVYAGTLFGSWLDSIRVWPILYLICFIRFFSLA